MGPAIVVLIVLTAIAVTAAALMSELIFGITDVIGGL